MPDQMGGQFYFAKAFDKFAPLGPTLISPEVFGKGQGLKLTTRVNGEVMQESEFMKDLIWSPAKILSWMSQGESGYIVCWKLNYGLLVNDLMIGTTIPQGTAVMTGTPAGVGAFRNPRCFLKDGDVVEVEISKVGILRNKICFS